ncbi:MAG: A24 family peptidase [Microthrixaceae bacterium]
MAISVIDLRTMIVPTRIVWPGFALAVAMSLIASGIQSEWAWLLTALVGLATLAGPLFVLWFILPKGMGFGDVRLSVLLGWVVGFYGGTKPVAGLLLAVLALFISAVVGLITGVPAMATQGRKAKVPWGPSLFAAALTVIALASRSWNPSVSTQSVDRD